MQVSRAKQRKEANRATNTRTRLRAYHEADDKIQPDDFEDYEEWMIGPNVPQTQST